MYIRYLLLENTVLADMFLTTWSQLTNNNEH